MFPAKRREMFEVFVSDLPSLTAEMFNCLFDVNRIPNGDGRDHEVERTGPIVLILQAAVMNAPQPMNTNRAGEGITRFPLVEGLMHLLPHHLVLNPLQCKEGSLQASNLSERFCPAVLTGILGQTL